MVPNYNRKHLYRHHTQDLSLKQATLSRLLRMLRDLHFISRLSTTMTSHLRTSLRSVARWSMRVRRGSSPRTRNPFRRRLPSRVSSVKVSKTPCFFDVFVRDAVLNRLQEENSGVVEIHLVRIVTNAEEIAFSNHPNAGAQERQIRMLTRASQKGINLANSIH